MEEDEGEEGKKEGEKPPIEMNRWTDRVNERWRWTGRKGLLLLFIRISGSKGIGKK